MILRRAAFAVLPRVPVPATAAPPAFPVSENSKGWTK